MLHTILDAFRNDGAALSLETLSRRVGVEPDALEGMLQTLVRKGRLIPLGPAADACQACALQQGCSGCSGQKQGYMLAGEK